MQKPLQPVTVRPRAGRLNNATAEISDSLMALGIILEPLNLEACRVLSYHFQSFFDLGAESSNAILITMRAELAERERRIKNLEEDLNQLRRENFRLHQRLR